MCWVLYFAVTVIYYDKSRSEIFRTTRFWIPLACLYIYRELHKICNNIYSSTPLHTMHMSPLQHCIFISGDSGFRLSLQRSLYLFALRCFWGGAPQGVVPQGVVSHSSFWLLSRHAERIKLWATQGTPRHKNGTARKLILHRFQPCPQVCGQTHSHGRCCEILGESASAQCVSIKSSMSKLWFCGATRAITQAAHSGTPLPWGPEILKRRRCTGHTASNTVWYDRDCANAREGGCRGGAAPPDSLSLH